MSLSTIADVWAIKIYSCYLLSTPTYIIAACFHALNRQFTKIITPMSADCGPTRTNTTALTTRSAETRFSCDSNDVSSGRCWFVKASGRPLEVGYLYHTYYFSNKIKRPRIPMGWISKALSISMYVLELWWGDNVNYYVLKYVLPMLEGTEPTTNATQTDTKGSKCFTKLSVVNVNSHTFNIHAKK